MMYVKHVTISPSSVQVCLERTGPDVTANESCAEHADCLLKRGASSAQSSFFFNGDPIWPTSRPVPYPVWGSVNPSLHFDDLKQFELLQERLARCVQQSLRDNPYNTVGNFLTFYDAYKKAAAKKPLDEFYRDYVPPITAEHHTCVGLGFDLVLKILELDEPALGAALFLASCEEDIYNVSSYVSGATPDTHTSEKEHVLVAFCFEIDGRHGVVLMDPGYHVAHPVVVMEDQLYPHTGWFKPGGTARSQRTYNYTLHPSGRYILWNVKEVRRGVEQNESALVYIHQAFLSPVESSERRNLVYDFKSLLKRTAEGKVTAGVYFALKPVTSGQLTIFSQSDDGLQVDTKIPFVAIVQSSLNESQEDALQRCGDQLDLGYGGLMKLLRRIAAALGDAEFLTQVLEINQRVVALSENN